eukprot:jgi/Tetstr1/455190/TSEL_042040.t1
MAAGGAKTHDDRRLRDPTQPPTPQANLHYDRPREVTLGPFAHADRAPAGLKPPPAEKPARRTGHQPP